MTLTRIKTNNILDRQVFSNDLADEAVTFIKIATTSGGNAGEVLKTDGLGNLYWEIASGASSSLDTLTDVDTSGKLNGDSLVYNSTSGQWEPGSNVPSSVSLNSLIDTTIISPLQDQYLRYNGVEWINDRVTAARVQGLSQAGLIGDFNSLTDVDMDPGPAVGQTIRWIGDRWIPGDTIDPSSIGNFDDVNLTGLSTGDVLSWNGTQFVPVDVGITPVSSNTFIVDTITERDLLMPQDGDQAFVRTGVSNEYELYIWDAAWILIGTADSARTDANTAEAIVLFNTGSPVLIGNVSDEARVTNVTIDVIVPFDGTPTLSVGDAGDNARLIDDAMFDLSEIGTYVCNTDYVYDGTEVAGTADTDIMAYFDFSSSTFGEARIIVTHV